MLTAFAAVVLQRTLLPRLLLDEVEELDELEVLVELDELLELVELDEALLLDAALDEFAIVLLLLPPPQAVNAVTKPSAANRVFIVFAPEVSWWYRDAGVTVAQDIANSRQCYMLPVVALQRSLSARTVSQDEFGQQAIYSSFSSTGD
jgi:hypothetical protein